jgi:hypothetical protein
MKMKKTLLLSTLFFSLLGFSQNFVNQVLILNEGYYDYTADSIISPVTVGSYNLQTNTYSTVNTLTDMRFASDLIIDGNFYYVAADTKIFKYDLDTHQEIAQVNCTGVRNIAVYNDKLIATRGEYQTLFGSYLHLYNSNNLQLELTFDTINGPKWASQNLVVAGNSAYIAVNNAYEWGNEKGIVGILNLDNLTYGNEIDLGANGENPDNMVLNNGFIYTVNNKDWSGSSVSKISVANGALSSTVDIASTSTGCGTSSLRDNKLVYQISQDNVLNEFDINLMNNIGPLNNFNLNYYELCQNPISGNLYASNTDFFSYGNVYIYDANNIEIINFSAGVSPGTIKFDIRSNTGIQEIENSIFLYPNPSSDILYFDEKLEGTINVYNILGEILISKEIKDNQNFINISDLKNGKYILQYRNSLNKVITKSFVKI